MARLSTILGLPLKRQPLLLLQSSASKSSLPIFRDLIACSTRNIAAEKTGRTKPGLRTLLFSLLYPPSSLTDDNQSESIQIYDLLANVPGYSDDWIDPRETILSAVSSAPSGPLDVAIDSVDTLLSDLGSPSQVYTFLRELLTIIGRRSQQHPSRLILHLLTPSCSELIKMLIQPAFSPALTCIIAHPPVILTHLATAYFTPPPPISPPAKFWAVFIPFSERAQETDRLVFGHGAVGPVNDEGEIVVEILQRGDHGTMKQRSVERTLEAWCRSRHGACQLSDLKSLKYVFSKRMVEEAPSDPMQNLSFNVNLTQSQQESRARVPLPYAHEGNPSASATSAILYDPDSADDIDDDDPDEDLDI